MSNRIYDELIAAGAPKLPSLYFYRIRVSPSAKYRGSSWVTVEVRERLAFGSKLRGKYQHVMEDRQFIGYICAQAYEKVWPRTPQHKTLEGDHP